jgi:hypothetical protein
MKTNKRVKLTTPYAVINKALMEDDWVIIHTKENYWRLFKLTSELEIMEFKQNQEAQHIGFPLDPSNVNWVLCKQLRFHDVCIMGSTNPSKVIAPTPHTMDKTDQDTYALLNILDFHLTLRNHGIKAPNSSLDLYAALG